MHQSGERVGWEIRESRVHAKQVAQDQMSREQLEMGSQIRMLVDQRAKDPPVEAKRDALAGRAHTRAATSSFEKAVLAEGVSRAQHSQQDGHARCARLQDTGAPLGDHIEGIRLVALADQRVPGLERGRDEARLDDAPECPRQQLHQGQVFQAFAPAGVEAHEARSPNALRSQPSLLVMVFFSVFLSVAGRPVGYPPSPPFGSKAK